MDPSEATDLGWDIWPSQLQFYPPVYVVPITLLTYPVSTCIVDHQLKRYEETAHSFTKDHDKLEIELSCNSVYELKDVIDIDGIITEFTCLKGFFPLTLYLNDHTRDGKINN